MGEFEESGLYFAQKFQDYQQFHPIEARKLNLLLDGWALTQKCEGPLYQKVFHRLQALAYYHIESVSSVMDDLFKNRTADDWMVAFGALDLECRIRSPGKFILNGSAKRERVNPESAS